MDDFALEHWRLNRRQFFHRSGQTLGAGLGTAALASVLNPHSLAAAEQNSNLAVPGKGGILEKFHHAPKAKRVIYLFMSGAPSQLDMLDYKPKMNDWFDKDLPKSIINGQRFTTMTSGQKRFPIAPSKYKFQQHGQSGAHISEVLPYTAKMVDDLAIVRSVHTEAINHDPAITYIQTGAQLPGRPSLGAWLTYGLGREIDNLPSFVVLHSSWSAKRDAQALYERLWGTGFLPSQYAGVSLRSKGDPVLYLSNPPGVSMGDRRKMLDVLQKLNKHQAEVMHDPETTSRMSQYEMAHRMQMSVPELTDIGKEPKHITDMYGDDVHKPGTFASNCLLARRLVERGTRFVQVFIRGWDQHGALPRDLPLQCKDIDQPSWALVQDLKQRGLLDDTLVVWGGEFGRTIYCQGGLSRTNYGRDHHPRCFSIWMAGGGIKPGMVYGKTDDFGYNVVENPVHIHDLNATLLHCLGINHEKLTYRYQGRDFRLTDVHGNIIKELLA